MQELIDHIFSIFDGSNELFGRLLTDREKAILKNAEPMLPEKEKITEIATKIKEEFGVDDYIAVCTAFCVMVRDIECVLTRGIGRENRKKIETIRARVKKSLTHS